MLASTADPGLANGNHPAWWLAGCAILGFLYLAGTAVIAMRSGYIDVQRTFLGFTFWNQVNSDDNPIQFWGAVILHLIGSVGCLVGLVLLLKFGTSQ